MVSFKRKRIPQYPARLGVACTQELFEDIEREAERNGWPVSEVARQALAAGLPTLKERRRKARREAGKEGGENGP